MSFLLETERLLLREIVAEDAQNIFHLNADSEVLKYTGDAPFTSLEAAALFIKNYSDYSRNGFGRWAIVLKNNHPFVGWCGLKLHANGMVDLGFRLMKKYWGQGYATEAAKACVTFGFQELKLKEIVGRAAPENTASLAVLEKCGMQFSHREMDAENHNKEIVVYKISSPIVKRKI